MTTETACLTSIWETDGAVQDYLALHGRAEDFAPLHPEDGAYYDGFIELDPVSYTHLPSPLVRAYCLEEKLGTPAHIYYKFEGNNTSGSHKLNSAIAQAYYAKEQGLTGVTTETGAGQWGTALSMACAYLGLDCHVRCV